MHVTKEDLIAIHAKPRLHCGIISALIGICMTFLIVYNWLLPVVDMRSTLQETTCFPIVSHDSVVWNYNVTVGDISHQYSFPGDLQDCAICTYRRCWYDSTHPEAGARFDNFYYSRNEAIITLVFVCMCVPVSLCAGIMCYRRRVDDIARLKTDHERMFYTGEDSRC